ncbi:hypothetical protein SLOPH_2353 [Spraguea lophii 42_110]|uniref:Protein SDA1 n=1 Tax=Spraguea lophii (strain 42_110) TaxID=1358809 RepID=S7XV58_SPRLO|nr:hypothetical protein SLOPH_2353 [Spraguea lophii 42_110]
MILIFLFDNYNEIEIIFFHKKLFYTMDLLLLKEKLSKDPELYKNEYIVQLELYKSLVKLPTLTKKNISILLDFLCFGSKYYNTEFSKVLIEHISYNKDDKIKIELLKSIFILKRKGHIDGNTFFDCIFNNCNKFRPYLNRCIKELSGDTNIIDIFYHYYKNGTEKQELFAVNLLIREYENNESERVKNILIEILLSDKKSKDMALFYFLDLIELEEDKEEIEEIHEKPRRGNRSKKVRKKEDTPKKEQEIPLEEKIKTKLSTFKNVDYSKIVKNLTEKESLKVAKNLFKVAKNTKGERDLKLKRLKLVSILKNLYSLKIELYSYIIRLIDPGRDDLNIIMTIFVESMSEQDIDGATRKIISTFCCEYHDDDFIVYGLNLLKEIALKFTLGEKILEEIKIFKFSKVKGIFYAYNLLQRVVKYGECEEREVDYIKKRRKKNNE